MIKFPTYLKKGDKISIVATARKISQEEVEFAVNQIKSWGLVPILGKHLFNQEHQFAGSDKNRIKDFQNAIDNPTIKAIFVARGGYGTVRIIDQLNWSKFKRTPKWIVGYSDITVLHSHIHNKLNIATIHGTMPINFGKDLESTESLNKLLFGNKIHYSVESHKDEHLYRSGKTNAQLVGGNLSILYSLNGTASDINTKGKVLFIEDLDEYLYHLDRMMLNLKRSGKLKGLKGLIVGGMSSMKDNLVPFGKTAEEIIFDAVKEYKYPVCFHFPAGHEKVNLAMKFGANVRLTVNKSKITFDQ